MLTETQAVCVHVRNITFTWYLSAPRVGDRHVPSGKPPRHAGTANWVDGRKKGELDDAAAPEGACTFDSPSAASIFVLPGLRF